VNSDPHLKLYFAGGTSRVRLICFPYAGGAAGIFRDWAEGLPGVEICAIQLPGRAERWREPVYTDLSQTVNRLSNIILPLIDRPFAIFGYSVGAQLAFELARILQGAGLRPDRLFVAAHRAPHVPAALPPLHPLQEFAFIREISRRYEPIPPAILADDEMRRLFLVPLQADISMLETHTFTPAEPLSCPISAFAGTSDTSIEPSKLAAWSVHTTSSFKLRQLPGGHFFFRASRGPLLEAIREDLREYAAVD
jgi:medium-chain acyl-[acyl-carrier-protein] hydrolase